MSRLQIAFDYLMVFIFVFLAFTVVFYSVSKQRIQASNQQAFSELQVIAQEIASSITAATYAGNGYNATIRLPGSLSLLQYNLSITKSGEVMVATNTFGQVISAYSSATSYGIASNPMYLSQSGQSYNIPTSQSSGTITLQNSFGTVCIDYSCPSSQALPAQLSAYESSTGAMMFGGATSRLYLYPWNSLSSVQTVSMWIDPAQGQGSGQIAYDEGGSGSDTNYIQYSSDKVTAGTSNGGSCTSHATVAPGTWTSVVFTFDGSNLYLYINGNVIAGCYASGLIGSQASSMTIGAPSSATSGSGPFNGLISNVQVYSTVLTAQQVNSLVDAGIAGHPVTSSALVGWWPLDGNTNDYSGNGYNLAQEGEGLFKGVAQISSIVTNSTAIPAAGYMVSYSASIGSVSTNSVLPYSVTDANGLSTAFITQQNESGVSDVGITAFNGNSSTAQYLLGWWPMNERQGAVVHDAIGNGMHNGNVLGVSWAAPKYVTLLDGQSGYIGTPYLQSAVTSYTIAAWIKTSSHGSNPIVQDRGSGPGDSITLEIGFNGGQGASPGTVNCGVDSNNVWIGGHTISMVDDGKWHFVACTFNSAAGSSIVPSDFNVYIDGVPAALKTYTEGSAVSPVTGLGGAEIGYHQAWNSQFNNNHFNGSMANVQIYGAALTQGQIMSIYQQGIGGAPLPSGLVGWWPLDGNTNDYSGNGYNATAFGGVAPAPYSAPQYKSVQVLAGSFDGYDSNVVIPGINSVIAATNSFTLSAWVNMPSTPNVQSDTWYRDAVVGSGWQNWDNYIGANQICGLNTFGAWTFGQGNNGAYTAACANSPYLPGTWYLVQATYNETALCFYLNAVLQQCSPDTTWRQGAFPYSIGSSGPSSTAYTDMFPGMVSDVQIYSAALTPVQLQSIYGAGLGSAPIINSSLAAWMPLDGNSNNYGNGGVQTKAYNVEYYQADLGVPKATPSLSGYGMYFNGAGGNVVVANGVQDTGPITLAAWVYPVSMSNLGNAGSVNRLDIVGQGSGSSGGYELAIGCQPGESGCTYTKGNSQLAFGQSFSSGWIEPLTAANVPLDSWSFVAGTWDGTTAKMYINGVLSYNGPMAGTRIASSMPTTIGSWSGVPGSYLNFFNGTIADVQIYGTALSPQQIEQLYSAGMPPYVSESAALGVNP